MNDTLRFSRRTIAEASSPDEQTRTNALPKPARRPSRARASCQGAISPPDRDQFK